MLFRSINAVRISPIYREYTRVMIHEILPVGMLQCNCSIFGDEGTRDAIVVDPGDEIESILAMVARHGLTVKSIVITHAHIDHIAGAQQLKKATGAPVYMNQNDTELQRMLDVQATWLGVPTPQAVEIDVAAKDGDTLLLGATELHVLHTPGHTQGSICLWMPGEASWSPATRCSAKASAEPTCRAAMAGRFCNRSTTSSCPFPERRK